MRGITLAVTLGLLVTIAMGGMSGTYTIKPGGGGNFLTLDAAGQALDSLGMSGNCVFEIYGDTLVTPQFSAYSVPGSETWTCTFRPGSGQNPVLFAGTFYGFFNNVKIENLELRATQVMLSGVSGCRVSQCRFTYVDQWGVSMEECSKDTVDDNTFQVVTYADYDYSALRVTNGDSILMFNNMVNSDSCPVEALVRLEHSRGSRFVFNTVRLSPLDAPISNAIQIEYNVPCEVRNNVFVVAVPADSVNACVGITAQPHDSILLDYNCYFVEVQGHVGAIPFLPNLYDWGEWRGFGFETHGINTDPQLFSSTDLHVRPGSPCNQRATPIAGIGFDIDGNPRDPTHPDMGADEITGDAVEETMSYERGTMKRQPTIVRGVLFLQEPAENGDSPPERLRPTRRGTVPIFRAVLLNATGRKVMDLSEGANDVRALAPGVYFVRGAQAQAQAQAVGKVILTK